jgi:hypothetical protein
VILIHVLDALILELNLCSKHVVLTSECHNSRAHSLCDVSQLGSQTGSFREWDLSMDLGISSTYERGGNTLWQLIGKLIDVKSMMKIIMEDEEAMLPRLLKENENTMSKEQRDCLEALLPLVTVYIYCSPCARLIHTALKVCGKLTSSLVRVVIRPDDRLVSSCCTASDRTLGLKSILDYVRQWEADSTAFLASDVVNFLDRIWLERRFDCIEYEQPYEYQESRECHAIILGEVDCLAQLLQKAPGRIPKATEIWKFRTSYSYPGSFTRQFICSFTEKRGQVGLGVHQAVAPGISLPQLAKEVTGSKRTSSPAPSESKRWKASTVPGDGVTGSNSNTNSMTSSPSEADLLYS